MGEYESAVLFKEIVIRFKENTSLFLFLVLCRIKVTERKGEEVTKYFKMLVSLLKLGKKIVKGCLSIF